jgi:hypothetical protein
MKFTGGTGDEKIGSICVGMVEGDRSSSAFGPVLYKFTFSGNHHRDVSHLLKAIGSKEYLTLLHLYAPIIL